MGAFAIELVAVDTLAAGLLFTLGMRDVSGLAPSLAAMRVRLLEALR